MTKYCLSAFADEAGVSLSEQIAALRRNNIRRIDVRLIDGINIADTPLDKIVSCKRELDKSDIEVAAVASPIGKFDIDGEFFGHREKFIHILNAAEALGTSRVRVFSFFTAGRSDYAEAQVAEYLNEMLNTAEKRGITLCHENEKGIYGDTDVRVLNLARMFGGRMKFIFDPANFIQCGCDPAAAYKKLRPYIDSFHIKDAIKATGEVVLPGAGDGSIADILADFAGDHSNIKLTVEPHLMSFVGLKDNISIRGTNGYDNSSDAFDDAVAALKNILDGKELSYE